MDTIGRKRWVIADGYFPGFGHGPAPEPESHGTCCSRKAGPRRAPVAIPVHLTIREPHASGIEADAPIVVRPTRLDSRQAGYALTATFAFIADP